MAKDPAFLFYPNDWLGGTLGMTLEQKGAYMELLMLQFNRGHMTKDMIGQVLGQEFGQIFGQIKDKFQVDEEGKYFNARLEEEQIKRKSFVASRKNNKLGKNQYTKKEGHMTSHMENENENIYSNRIYNSKGYITKEGECEGERIFGKYFSDEKNALFMSDETFMEISEKQKQAIKAGKLKPYKIFKN
jgi:uncharacterized protein YdaU (DUF1376 family)